MKKLIEDGNMVIRDPKTIEQLADFQDLGNDKFGGVSTHDDLVSALYWTAFVLEQQVFDETYEFSEETGSGEEVWGLLADIDDYAEDQDWSWLTD